jgi:hypothetical protein
MDRTPTQRQQNDVSGDLSFFSDKESGQNEIK